MNEQEKIKWVKENYTEKDFDFGMKDLEQRLARKAAKESRILRVFKNLDEFNEYSETHKMGEKWAYDSNDFNGEYGEEYEDFMAICAYEYK